LFIDEDRLVNSVKDHLHLNGSSASNKVKVTIHPYDEAGKFVAEHDIAEILLKVALNTINQIKSFNSQTFSQYNFQLPVNNKTKLNLYTTYPYFAFNVIYKFGNKLSSLIIWVENHRPWASNW
jgi:hypothetical protein